MCGIIGAIAIHDISSILINGLKRLEYRGYDSAGIAVITPKKQLKILRALGKINNLEKKYYEKPITGHIGIAHTRWATHGKPSEKNAHPHTAKNQIALVHNGIIENYQAIKQQLKDSGYQFSSDTDTEVIVNTIHQKLQKTKSMLTAIQQTLAIIEGAYAIAVIDKKKPDHMIATRRGSSLVIGIGNNEHFIASDIFALLNHTQQFIILEEGDIAEIHHDKVVIYDNKLQPVKREIIVSDLSHYSHDKLGYRHHMLKEIFEQPSAINNVLNGRIKDGRVVATEFGNNAEAILKKTQMVTIVACGTSYHAGLIARYWLEEIAGISCQVDISSEYRYRSTVVNKNHLFICISQSGETADTLAALRKAKDLGYLTTLGISNVPESSLARITDAVFLTHTGIEISVASTKAFTAQLIALLLLAILLGRYHKFKANEEKELVEQLCELPNKIQTVLEIKDEIEAISKHFANKHHALYLGRGSVLPVAMEGALKLKEISYIHAEAYAAGELKHGPLALVDNEMPIIAIAPNNQLVNKLKSNLEEVMARGGELYLFADTKTKIKPSDGIHIIRIKNQHDITAPIIYTIPLQLLAYYIAVIKGADIDQPRNLAKSVTVE